MAPAWGGSQPSRPPERRGAPTTTGLLAVARVLGLVVVHVLEKKFRMRTTHVVLVSPAAPQDGAGAGKAPQDGAGAAEHGPDSVQLRRV